MQLNELKANKGAKQRKIRVGRGIGSSKGKTCGRGGKGQTSRTGVAINGFEGGQTPIHRRLPKRGFNNHTRVEYASVNVSDIQKAIDAGTLDGKKDINLEALQSANLVRSNETRVKLLAKGEIKAKVTVQVDKASKAAQAAVEKAGGKIILPAAA
ncbi:MAG: 50S ribosomal protein L15 [Rickettsiales bacterium]